MTTYIPIASLDPTSSPPQSTTIKGVVTLVWPYSSSTRQCAFLLADPDFRLRSKKGQVRVRFTGASAKAVAEKHVGIGDAVVLELQGARWEEDRERSKTPGRSVEGELVFRRKVGLSLRRGGGGDREGEGERVDVDAPPSPPASRNQEVQVNGHTEASTPAPAPPRASKNLLRRSLDGSLTNGGWTYSSPAFAKRVRLSGEGGLLNSAFDPFVDGEEGKRTSFGTGLKWRLGSRTPSPVKEGFGRESKVGPSSEEDEELEVEVEKMMESPSRSGRVGDAVVVGKETRAKGDESELVEDDDNEDENVMEVEPQTSLDEEAATTMRPPELPHHSMPSQDQAGTADQLEDSQQSAAESPSTPKLRPVKSPTLPLPSPFPADAPSTLFGSPSARPPPFKANSLFGALGNAASVIERRRLSGRVSQSSLQPPKPASLPPPRNPVVSQPVPPVAPESVQELDAAEPSAAAQPTVTGTVDLTDDHDEKEDAEMSGDAGPAQGTDVNQSFSTTIPDDDMYDDYQKALTGSLEAEEDVVRREHEDMAEETHGNEQLVDDLQDGDEIAGREDNERVDVGQEIGEVETVANDAMESDEKKSPSPTKQAPDAFSLDGTAAALPQPKSVPQKRKPELDAERLRTAEPTAPSTPAQRPPPGPFGLDCASATPISARVTPQSEKERVKKSTYRSLFGLRSPQKEQAGAMVAEKERERQEERFIPGWFFEVQGQRERDTGAGTATRDEFAGAEARAEVDAAVADDVATLDDDNRSEQAVTASEETDHVFARVSQPGVVEGAPRPSKLQVIELDASSDVEEPEAEDKETPKPAAPELPSSSPVIQDSLEDSQDEAFVVSEDERVPRRNKIQSRVETLKDEGTAESSPLSSPLPETRLADLAMEADKASVAPVQDQLDMDHEMVSSPTPKPADLPVPGRDVEEHIAPPRSTATTTVVDLASSSESEEFPSSPILGPRRTMEDTPVQSQDSPQSSAQAPSYPTLPLSPSNSQSLRGMQSQPEIQESVRTKLPPTPQLTQRESSTRTDEHSSQRTPAPKLLRNESSLRAEVKAAESPITPQTKTPSRRSARLRTSNVPDVLSEWFSPRSSGVAPDAGKTAAHDLEPASPEKDLNGAGSTVANGHSTPSKPGAVPIPATGFATAHSYFTSLSKLPELTNPSSQHGALDTLAVVIDKTAEPVRAKTGPRDYFTIFHIVDPSIPSDDSIRVEVFRPYKATLPVAEIGDAVLLRGFAVKSRKRTPYLLSTDASAWCVWQFKDAVEDSKPAWARKGRKAVFKEEIKGPPVEFGEEERSHAWELRNWWLEMRRGGDGEGDGRSEGEVVREVVAKL